MPTKTTSRPAAARGRRPSGEARERILLAAVEEFAVRGLHGTSTETIAARAGVSQPYVFRLYGSKQQLFLEAVDRGHQRLLATFREAAAEAMESGFDPFPAMGAAYLRLLNDRAQLLVQMQAFIAAADEPQVRSRCQAAWEELITWLETLPGATPETVSGFVATGMLLDVFASIGLFDLLPGATWAQRCVEGMQAGLIRPRTQGDT